MTSTKKTELIARLVVEYRSKRREAIEIHADSSFHVFYYIYVFTGKRKKDLVSTRTRNYSGVLVSARGGLEGVLDYLKTSFKAQRDPIQTATIKIYKKRLYKKLLNCRPDELGDGLPKHGEAVVVGRTTDRKPTPEEIIRVEYRRQRQAFIFGWSTKEPISKPNSPTTPRAESVPVLSRDEDQL